MAVDSKSILTGAAIFGTILIGIVMAVFVSTNAAGGIAALVPLITVILTLLALINPRAGIFGLAALVIWVDEFKRLAVYYGGAYSMTVMQTLAMPFIVLAALNAGFLLNLMFGKVKIDRTGLLIYLSAGVVGVSIFLTMEGGMAERAQRAANVGGYLTLIPIACTYFKGFDEWKRFFSFQVLVALPSIAWAIKQYYFGFNDIEWAYARSGLSKVHYGQMMLFTNPRTFGFFGSASALGCAAVYGAFAWWHAFRYPARRWLVWVPASILISWALVASTQRTALLYPLIVFVCAFVFRTRLRTGTLYLAGILTFVIAVASSDYLLNEGIHKINQKIEVKSGWGQEVLRVSTFSDRLRGWQRLKRAESWSVLGTGKEKFSGVSTGSDFNSSDYNHDVINKILISFGVVGLLVVLIPAAAVLRVLHQTAFKQETMAGRNDTAFALALSLPMIMLSFVGGDNFNTNPINLQIWTSFVGVLVSRATIRKSFSAMTPTTGNVPASQAMLSPVARRS